MRYALALSFVLVLAAVPSQAGVCQGKSHPGVTAIFLSQSTKAGSAGEEWVNHFKDQIKESDPYCLVDDKDKAVMVISVVGMDADLSKTSTAISLAIYTAKESLFLDHWMYVAANENLENSSEKAVTALEKEMRELRRLRIIK